MRFHVILPDACPTLCIFMKNWYEHATEQLSAAVAKSEESRKPESQYDK